MANGNRTAADVLQLETDNEYLRNENERLEREVAILTHERSRLQIENAMLEGRARENLVSATRMETIIRQVSSGLVTALSEVTQERTVAREVRKQVQEEHLAEETGAPPVFLRQPPAWTRGVSAEKLTEAAEHVGPSAHQRHHRVDNTLANRDSRLPTLDFPGRDEDAENLARLAGEMEPKAKQAR